MKLILSTILYTALLTGCAGYQYQFGDATKAVLTAAEVLAAFCEDFPTNPKCEVNE